MTMVAHHHPPRTNFLAFLRIGPTAYGMAILQKLCALVIRNGRPTEKKTQNGGSIKW
jgi:hypothetical protein